MKWLRLCSIWTAILLTACTARKGNQKSESLQHFAQYSEFVKDTFYIDVHLPKEYYTNPDRKYPTAILLDANFYFPMMSSIIKEYEVAGLLEPMIVVGIGYRSFAEMDSLRERDYLFPAAIPSDEITTIGGGQNFYNFITRELLPGIDKNFRTDKEQRTLLGHSFGGYFVLYSLLQQSVQHSDFFKNFISASPSLWYNNFYLNQLPEQLSNNKKEMGLYLSVGGLEDSTWSVKPLKELDTKIQNKKIVGLDVKTRIFNHLDHMDVGLLTFTKGLQELTTSQ